MGGCDAIAQRHRLPAHRRQRRVAARRATSGCTSSSTAQADTCEPEWVGAEHPLFILYTSGSTGKPKGVQHSHRRLPAVGDADDEVDVRPQADDVFWCTADIGWVTGHTYITLRPARVGATEVVFEGVPTYPDAGRFWKMIAGPQGQRLLHRADRDPLADQGGRARRATCTRRTTTCRACASSARSASRSIPEAWMWYHKNVGGEPLPDRRHLVADRNRRPHDHAAAGRDAARAGLVHAAAAGHHGGDRRRDRPRRAERARAASSSSSGRGRR